MGPFFDLRNEGGKLSVDGRAVRKARLAAGLTQADLSSRMSLLGYFLTQPYVSTVERGRYPYGFTERMATALAAALGVGVSELTGGRLLTEADVQHVRELTSRLDDVIEPGSPLESKAG
ncbi:MAG: helix-turn-helix domain-containing protein [Streptosporangiaceae bacterium]